MSPLKPTDELLNKLNRAKEKNSLDVFLSDLPENTPAFSDYYFALPAVQTISTRDLMAASGIERTYFYQIKNGTRRPGRDKVLALCIAAGLEEKEVRRCLELADAAILYPRVRRDAVILYAIKNRYTLSETNALLDEYGEALIK